MADAWGMRDTMRSRQLSPCFAPTRSETRAGDRRDEKGTLRQAQAQDSWAAQAFSRYVRYDYRVRRPTEDRGVWVLCVTCAIATTR